MKTALQWIEVLTHVEVSDVDCPSPHSQRSFVKDCLDALRSTNQAGVTELVRRMNASPCQMTALDIWMVWNAGASPVRNFLIVRLIDYPE